MTFAKKNFEDLTAEDTLRILGRPVYIGLTARATGEKVVQAIGVAVNIQESVSSNRALFSLSDGENTTPVDWDTDQYASEIVWETYDE